MSKVDELIFKITIGILVTVSFLIIITLLYEQTVVSNEQVCLNANMRPVYVFNPTLNNYEVILCNEWHTLNFYSIKDEKLVEVRK
jgi:hypothetical protein